MALSLGSILLWLLDRYKGASTACPWGMIFPCIHVAQIPNLFWKAAHLPLMIMLMPQDVEASTYNPRSDKGPRGQRDWDIPGKVSLTSHHFKSVIRECREYLVRNSSPWKVDAKLEREGKCEWPSRYLCMRPLQAWQERVPFCNGNSVYSILLTWLNS